MEHILVIVSILILSAILTFIIGFIFKDNLRIVHNILNVLVLISVIASMCYR